MFYFHRGCNFSLKNINEHKHKLCFASLNKKNFNLTKDMFFKINLDRFLRLQDR